jgi:hypothetical protein
MLSPIPSHPSGPANSTPSQAQLMTVRQRLFGNRSTRFLVVMGLVALLWLPAALWPEPRVEPLLRCLALTLGTCLAWGLDARVRVTSVLLLITWLAVLGGAPLPLAIGLGAAAMVLSYLDERATEQLDAQALVQTRPELSALVHRLVTIKIGNAIAIAPAFAAAGASILVDQGVPTEAVEGLLAVAAIVFAAVLYRQMRQFAASVVGRPA